MKTANKPKGGCRQHGFTYVEADGQFIKIGWKDLQNQGMALHKLEENQWKIVRNIPASEPGSQLGTFAIGPKGADFETLAKAAKLLPTDLLSGGRTKTISRIRELATLDPLTVRASNIWRDLAPEDRDLLRMLWSTQEKETANQPDRKLAATVSDLDILNRRLTIRNENLIGRFAETENNVALYGQHSGTLLDIPTRVAAMLSSLKQPAEDKIGDEAGKNALQAQITGMIHSRIAAGDINENHVDAVLEATKMYLPKSGHINFLKDTLDQTIDLLSEFRDSDTPLEAMWATIYDLPLDNRKTMMSALQLLNSYAITGPEAAALAALVHATIAEPAEQQMLITLLETRLQQNGGGISDSADVVAAYRKSGRKATIQYGTVGDYLAREFPTEETWREVLALNLWLNPSDKLTATTVQTLERFDRETLQQTFSMLAGIGEQGEEVVRATVVAMAVDAVGTFGKQAPEWLLQTATSSDIDKIRRRRALPNENVTRKRIVALTALQTKPPITQQERTEVEDKITLYANLLNAVRCRQIESLLNNLDISDRNELAAELAGLTSKMTTKALQSDTYNDSMLLELLPNATGAIKKNTIASELQDSKTSEANTMLQDYANALKQNDHDNAVRIGRMLLDEHGAQMLPPEKVLRQRLAALQQQIETRDTDAIRKDLGLWEQYRDALDAGDCEGMLRINDTITARRKDVGENTETYVSPHDAVYWLTADPRQTVAPDGTTLGDWLLANGRGREALTTETGRRSLELAVQNFGTAGRKDISVRQLSDVSATNELGGYTDETTIFFGRNRISTRSAEITINAMRESVNTPTLLPLTDLYQDTTSGMRGYFLPRKDPRGMQLGVLTGCCQHPDSQGRSCAVAGQTHPSSGFFVVEDKSGKIVAQSWMWAATDNDGRAGIIFDNIETLTLPDTKQAAVRLVYEQAADALATRYDRVLVGGKNDINMQDLPLTERSLEKSAIGYWGHSDAQTQRLVRGEDTHRSGNYLQIWPQTDSNSPQPSYNVTALALPIAVVSESEPAEQVIRFHGRKDGYVITDGANRVMVSTKGDITLEGDNARHLAETELAKMGTRTYRCIDTDGQATGETISVESEPVHGWEIDVTTLPKTYDSGVSADMLATLKKGGISKRSALPWLKLAEYDTALAIRMHDTGWSVAAYKEILRHGTDKRWMALRTQMPDALRGKNSPMTQHQYLKQVNAGVNARAHGGISTDTVLKNKNLADMLERHWGNKHGRYSVPLAMGENILPAVYNRTDVSEIYTLAAKVSDGLIHDFSKNPRVVTALRAVRIADEIKDAGLTSKETTALVSRQRVVGVGNTAKHIPIVCFPTLREEWQNMSSKERELVLKTEETLGPKSLTNWTTLLTVAKRDYAQEILPAKELDTQDPVRGLRVLDALAKDVANAGKTHAQIAKTIRKRYTEITNILEQQHGEPVPTEHILQLLKGNPSKVVEFTTQVWADRRGRTGTAEVLLILANTSKKRRTEIVQLLQKTEMGLSNMTHLAMLVSSNITATDIMPKIKTATKNSIQKKEAEWSVKMALNSGLKRKDIKTIDYASGVTCWDLEMALNSGLKRKDIKTIMGADHTMWTKRLLLGSPEARQAVANKVPQDVIDGILVWDAHRGNRKHVLERGTQFSVNTDEWWRNEAKLRPWLLRYASGGKANVERLQKVLAQNPPSRSIVGMLLADIEVPAILGGLDDATRDRQLDEYLDDQ